ncbi:MAG TPA: 1-acyl-sn-glycerol-3-phosphate acyltransferase [Bacteroidia bacterium]|nr:1-acyl-sn-glycerol-3-phosphate acyltransferase [Bacteroidia bacterium]
MKTILHSIIRLWLRLTSSFFFDKVQVSGIENIPFDCPVIFASNHPNAFLDSLVMTTCIKRELYYTARGDFFKSKIANTLLRYINILPVYRKEEGKELMHKNTGTFSACIEIFKKNGAVTIFTEGFSENKYELRPLRKGTARLAFEAWNNPEIGAKLKVVPVAIHYSSWLKIHPVVYVEFLKNIEKDDFDNIDENGLLNKKFNDLLREALAAKCIMIDQGGNIVSQNKITGFILKNYLNGTVNAKILQNKYVANVTSEFRSRYKELSDFLINGNINYDMKFGNAAMNIINLIGWFIVFGAALIYNFIPYYLCRIFVRKTTKSNDFHDSLLYCMLLMIYPLYLFALFSVFTHYANFQAGILAAFLAAFSAFYYEAAKRYILSFFKKKQLIKVKAMFKGLFETNNG